MVIGIIGERGELVIEWSITDFFLLRCENDVSFKSPSFSFENESWHLEIYPKGAISNKTRGYIDLFLERENQGPPIKVEFSLAVKTEDEDVEMEHHSYQLLQTRVFEEADNWGALNLLSRTELSERESHLLPCGTLTLVCRIKCPQFTKHLNAEKCSHCKEVVDAKNLPSHEKKCIEKPIKCPECSDVIALKNWYEHECKTVRAEGTAKCSHCKEVVDAKTLPSHEKKCMEKPIKCPECSDVVALKNWYEHDCKMERVEGVCNLSASNVILPKNKILQDFKELFLRKENCDVVFRVKDEEINAHKAILSVRSPVFSSTFQHDMREKRTGVVNIEDFDPCTFSDFLCFLYCEEIENLSEKNVFGLFTAADKYDVPDLKKKCIEFMKANLLIETFCDTITLALKHTETELIILTTDFFIKNADKIIETVKWQTFLDENPTHSNELFIKLLAYNKSLKK